MIFDSINCLLLATNNGSLHYSLNYNKDALIFASESQILKNVIKNNSLESYFNYESIDQLKADSTLLINLSSLDTDHKKLGELDEYNNIEIRDHSLNIVENYESIAKEKLYKNTSLNNEIKRIPKSFIELYEARSELVSNIKRCKICILPITHPYIEFDENGICNYCSNYKKNELKGKDSFAKIVNKYNDKKNKYSCLVPLSGGRDSCFTLHYIKTELGLNPLAYSYDWGMLTGLARRNQSRMCGKLGVEHILVSADIRKKRKNIKKNVLAWLKKPHLGMIPIFMAGDKQYYYYTNKLMEQYKIGLSIMGENLLETTNFKSGFAGIKPTYNKENTYSLNLSNKIKMLYFYGNQYLTNSAYLNSSLIDTLDAFKSYYIIKHDNTNIFNYVKWDEDIINNTLIKEYNWEIDPGTKTTWRIGDGTAAFYNYIYFMVCGFSENDTFRSNQIRENLITREQALEKVYQENMPRWDSINWYCNTIKIKFEDAIEKINDIDPIFKIFR